MGKPFPYIGMDGCPAGWFYVAIDDRGEYSFDILEHFAEIDRLLPTAALILVDIPIGLPSRDSPDRQCDKAARQMIKPRGSSVFPAPARSALSKKTYTECCDENFRVLGRKLSRQSWALARKIAEVDAYLRATRPGNVREMHPEVAFCGLNGGIPMAHSKKRTAGVNERLAVLCRHWAPAEDCYITASKKFRRKQVGRDDIVDAIAGAVVARKGPGLATLLDQPTKDEEEMVMEIVYWAAPNST